MNKTLLKLGAFASLMVMPSCSFLKKEIANHVDISETDTAIVLDVSAGKSLGKNSATISVQLDVNKDTIPDYIAHFIAPKSPKEQEVLDKLLKDGEEVALKEIIKKANHIHPATQPCSGYKCSQGVNVNALRENQQVNTRG